MEDNMEARREFILEFDPDDFLEFVYRAYPDISDGYYMRYIWSERNKKGSFMEYYLKIIAKHCPELIDEYVGMNDDDYRYWLE